VLWANKTVLSGGDTGMAYNFLLPHIVNVTNQGNQASKSNFGTADVQYANRGSGATKSIADTKSMHRLLIDNLVVDSSLFTYAVPSVSHTAFLRAWATYDATNASPLLPCSDVRLFLQGTYAGTTSIPRIQPGAELQIGLGEDKNTEITSTFVLPTSSEKEQDKSTWFIQDKKKFRVKTTEYVFTVRSTHEAPRLVSPN